MQTGISPGDGAQMPPLQLGQCGQRIFLDASLEMLLPGGSRCTGGVGVPDALQIGLYLIRSICRRWRCHDGSDDLWGLEEGKGYLIYIYSKPRWSRIQSRSLPSDYLSDAQIQIWRVKPPRSTPRSPIRGEPMWSEEDIC